MVTTVRSGHGGEELNVEFKKATIHMEMSAFQKLAKKQFKGVYWLRNEPVVSFIHFYNHSAFSVVNFSVGNLGFFGGPPPQPLNRVRGA